LEGKRAILFKISQKIKLSFKTDATILVEKECLKNIG